MVGPGRTQTRSVSPGWIPSGVGAVEERADRDRLAVRDHDRRRVGDEGGGGDHAGFDPQRALEDHPVAAGVVG